MEETKLDPAVQQITDPNDPATLGQAERRLKELMLQPAKNAWDLGDLLNKIVRSRLTRPRYSARAWVEATVPRAKRQISALYRYASVAAKYSKKDVEVWGMAKLECLINHDEVWLGKVLPGDPAARELEVRQEDGSTVTKKFGDCTCRELRRSWQARIKEAGKARQQEQPEDQLVRVLTQALAARKSRNVQRMGVKRVEVERDDVQPRSNVHPLRSSLALIVLGHIAFGTAFILLPNWLPGSLLAILGPVISATGVGMLIRHYSRISAQASKKA